MADVTAAGPPQPVDDDLPVDHLPVDDLPVDHLEPVDDLLVDDLPVDHLEPVDEVPPDGRPEPGPVATAGRPKRGAGARPAPVDQTPAFGSRREARERALSLLYEADAKDLSPADLLAELPVEPPPYAVSLVAGVGECQARIDELIDRFAIDWTIDRMPVIDRTIVRMATFELLCRADVPTGVVISEAVELAKRYSTEESGRFVNGVLASIATETRPPEGPPAG